MNQCCPTCVNVHACISGTGKGPAPPRGVGAAAWRGALVVFRSSGPRQSGAPRARRVQPFCAGAGAVRPTTLCNNRWACRSDRRADIPSDARCRARHARRDATNAPSHLSRPRPTSVLAGAGHAVGRLLVAAQRNPVLRTLPPACCAQPSQLFTKTRSRPLAPPGLRNSRRASLRESSTRPRRASHTALAWEYHAR